jgi:hypothetical protein
MTYSPSDNNNINNDKDDEDKSSYEEISVVLRLKKNIVQILRIFANTYYGEKGSTEEEKRIDNFLSEEVTKIVETLASDSSGPAQEPFPDSLKQYIQSLLKDEKT